MFALRPVPRWPSARTFIPHSAFLIFSVMPPIKSQVLPISICVGNVECRFMPFIFIFREWERPPGQKTQNAFANHYQPSAFSHQLTASRWPNSRFYWGIGRFSNSKNPPRSRPRPRTKKPATGLIQGQPNHGTQLAFPPLLEEQRQRLWRVRTVVPLTFQLWKYPRPAAPFAFFVFFARLTMGNGSGADPALRTASLSFMEKPDTP